MIACLFHFLMVKSLGWRVKVAKRLSENVCKTNLKGSCRNLNQSRTGMMRIRICIIPVIKRIRSRDGEQDGAVGERGRVVVHRWPVTKQQHFINPSD